MSFPNVVWCPGSGEEVYHSCNHSLPGARKRGRKVRCSVCKRRLKTKRDVGDGQQAYGSFYECYSLRIPRHKPK